MIFNDERLDTINDGLMLIQKKNGLTFGTDAYLLFAYMKAKPSAVAADFGAGTGIISLLSLRKNKFKTVHAIEVQESFSALCRRNAELNRLSDRMITHYTDVRSLKAEALGGEVDIVFSNPPYMAPNSGFHNDHDEKFIARHEVMGSLDDFCKAANRILKYGGSFYLVYRADRLCDLLVTLRQNSLEPKRVTFVYNSENHAPVLVLVEAKKGAAPSLFVTKPLILCDSEGNESDTIKKIYEIGGFDKQYERP